MTDNLAIGINLAVAGFYLAVLTLLPRHRAWVRALAVAVALGCWARYLAWRVTSTAPESLGSLSGAYFLAILSFELVAYGSMVIFFVILSRWSDRSPEADRHEAWLRSQPPDCLPSVDVFFPTYNEDWDVLERGIVAALALDYPRFRVWVLDDGRRDWLRGLCATKGVGYIRRPNNQHAKAGNINHALSCTKGELFVVFDADFAPHRNFLYRTVGFFFADPRIAIVQTPQHFFNPDIFQTNLGLADVLPDNEREWYDVILPCRDAWDCAFCCGSCAVFRRDAIQGIGGMATESVTEDILTSLKLLAGGHITRYLNECLSMGLSPETARSLLIQRRRWARGNLQLLFLKNGLLTRKLRLFQWLFFVPYYYLLDFLYRLAMIALPLVYLWTGWTHFTFTSTAELLAYMVPALVSVFLLHQWLVPNGRVPFISSAIEFYISSRVYPTVLSTLLKPFGTPFQVTPKGQANSLGAGDGVARRALAVVAALTVGGIVVSGLSSQRFQQAPGHLMASVWALFNLVMVGMTQLAIKDRPRLRREERFAVNRPGSLAVGDQKRDCTVINLSLTGAMLGGVSTLASGQRVELSLGGIGPLDATVIRVEGGRAGVRFENVHETDRDQLIRYLYASGRHNTVTNVRPFRVLLRLFRGAFIGAR
jgi:cellulose synthase (UDP-forming)